MVYNKTGSVGSSSCLAHGDLPLVLLWSKTVAETVFSQLATFAEMCHILSLGESADGKFMVQRRGNDE